jgi:hypothetical protein
MTQCAYDNSSVCSCGDAFDCPHKASAVVIDHLDGWCPVEAEGTIGGQPFYFRARGQRWTIGVGGDTVMRPDWSYGEPFGHGPFDAGHMAFDDARAFIDKAAGLYSAYNAAIKARAPGKKPNDFDVVNIQHEVMDHEPVEKNHSSAESVTAR